LARQGPLAAMVFREELSNGVIQGRNAKEIARLIRNRLYKDNDGKPSGQMYHFLRIARTETIRAYRETSHRTYQENSDVLEGWIWLSALNWRTCFPAGTEIVTKRGRIAIESVRIGDEVLTHKGRFRKVTETLARAYSGSMITVDAATSSVVSTPEHPFYVYRNGKM